MTRAPIPSRSLVALLALAALAAAPAFAAVAGQAILTIPAGSESEIKAKESLRVVGVPVPAGAPVAEETVVVAVDLTELEKALAEARARYNSAQATQRQRTVDRPATAPSAGQTSGGGDRSSRLSTGLEDQQDAASRELPTLQSRIAAAPVKAPSDGYFVRSLFEVGMTTQKRKPAALFVPFGKTVVEVKVPAAEAAALGDAREVVVTLPSAEPAGAAGNEGSAAAKSFRAKVEGSTPQGDQVSLRLKPLELPFLVAGSATPVTVSPSR